MADQGSGVRDTRPGAGASVGAGAAAGDGANAGDVEEVTVAVMSAAQLLCGISARALARVDETLTLPQLRLMVVLGDDGPEKLSALASALGVNPSTAMRMVDRLEHGGLVERRPNPASRREVIVALTGWGEELVAGVMAHRRAEIADLLGRLSAEQLGGLVGALRAFTDAGADAGATGAEVGRDPCGAVHRTGGLPAGNEAR